MTTTASPMVAPPSADQTDHSSGTPDTLRNVMEQVAGNARADVAFGTPQVIGARTLIPVARVMYAYGSGSDNTKHQGGTGTGLSVRPLGVIEVTQDKMRVVSIVDVQTMMRRFFAFAIGAIVFAAFMSRARARRVGTQVKIGRIEPRLSVSSTPRIHFQRRRG